MRFQVFLRIIFVRDILVRIHACLAGMRCLDELLCFLASEFSFSAKFSF